MEFFLFPLPIWIISIIYLLSLLESALAALRYTAHWGFFALQAGTVIFYAFYSFSVWSSVETVGMLQYALFLQFLVIIIAFYGAYRWYSVSELHWRNQYHQTGHLLDNDLRDQTYKPQNIQILQFAHYVALTFVVIVFWLFLAKMYSLEVSLRSSNQGLVGLIAFVLALHYIGNFLLAHFFLEGWILRSLARIIEIVFLIFRGMASPMLIGILSTVLLVNIWGWWRWRKMWLQTLKK